MQRIWLFVPLLFITTRVMSQEQLQSDIGDQNAQVLNKGETQVEAAAVYNRFDDKSPYTLVGELFLRYGLTKGIELRALIEEGRRRDKFMEETMQGFYPLCIGAKVSLVKDKDFLPDVALSGYLNLPFTAHTGEQSIHWSPAVIAIFEKELKNKKWDFLANAGFQQNSFNRDIQWQATARVKYQGLKDMDITLEYFDNYQAGENPQHCIDLGYTYTVNNNFEINTCAGTTIFSKDVNEFVSLGFSVRLP